MAIPIVVNGEDRTVSEGQTILGLLRELEVDPERVAVEMDRLIVKQAKWEGTTLAAGSKLEIVQFVGGG
ncbi:MAG TPA: sulfur carrier protein ThiS [Bryobacteraceae bacterium]|nr:sulfur carrier protein ThiS [Bryobacteraceae bacterium]